MSVYLELDGHGDSTLVLLHGLGATGAVWGPFRNAVAGNWEGCVAAPDLPGHGGSSHLDSYEWQECAEELKGSLPGDELIVVGHSLGGAVGIALARFDERVVSVVSMSVKVVWSESDLERANAIAAAGVKWFDDEQLAWERFVKVAGLGGREDDKGLLGRGVVANNGRFRLAQDPATNAMGVPPLHLLRELTVPMQFVCGEHDPMVTGEQMAVWGRPVQVWEGVGHHPHLEAPGRLLEVLTTR